MHHYRDVNGQKREINGKLKTKHHDCCVNKIFVTLFLRRTRKIVRAQARLYAPQGPSLTQLSRLKNISCLQAWSKHLSQAADRSNSTESVADQRQTVPDLVLLPCCEHPLSVAKARRRLAPLAPLF